MNFKNNICLHVHQGCGDHLILNGLVRHLAKIYDLVVVPAKTNNFESVAYMYRDLSNVVVRYVLDDNDQTFFFNEVWKGKKLALGNGGEGGFIGARFDTEFYRQADLSFQLRWDYFHFERDTSQEVNINLFTSEPTFAFIHEDGIRNMPIRMDLLPNIEHVRPDVMYSRNIFAWVPLLVNATEIHCINSSFAILVDSMERVPGQKLYLHAYARVGETPTFRYDWIILK